MKSKISSLCLAAFLPVLAGTVLTGCDRDRADRVEKDRPPTQRTAGEQIDDKAVTARVKGALSDNPDYKFGDVSVSVLKGTVQLSGFVNTAEQKTKAGEIAKNVQNVKNVENKITVK
jgi:hyperosmotically inducible protein